MSGVMKIKGCDNGCNKKDMKVLHLSKSKKYERTSMLVFAAALVSMERSLWKLRRLTTWSPRRVRYLRERDNYPRSMFCMYVKDYWIVHGGCVWSSWVVAKSLFLPVDVSINGESIVLLSMVNMDVAGASSKLSRWTILEPPLGNAIVYISPNWSGGGMLKCFSGIRDTLTVQ